MNAGSAGLVLVLPAIVLGQNWVARYDGPVGGADKAAAICADATGSVYVTGFSTGSGSGRDFLTIKYSLDGETLWVSRLSGGGSAADQAADVECGPGDDLYVTGFTTAGGGTDFWTVRYRASTGETLWARRYGGTGTDLPVALVVDGAGSVFVGGSAVFSTRTNATVVKYDSFGVQGWVTRVPARTGDSASAVTALARAPGGGVYAAGWLRAGTMTDYFVARLRATGETAWVRTYAGAATGYDTARAVASDAAGNVYVTGVSMNSTTDYDYATLKYDSFGNQTWVMRYNGPEDDDDGATAIAIDSAGNVYVTGHSTGTGSRYDDFATVSYSSSGAERWVARYHGGSGDDGARALALERDAFVYVTGYSESGSNGNDLLTVKYDTAGVQQWLARYNYTPPNRDDEGVDLAVAAPGFVCVTGFSWSTTSDTDYVTIQYVDHDAGIVAILQPPDTVPPLPFAPEVRIVNEGVSTDDVAVYAEIHDRNHRVYSQSVVVTGLRPGQTYDAILPGFSGQPGSHTLRCSVAVAGDLNRVNDTMSRPFEIAWRESPYWLQQPDFPSGVSTKPVKDGGALCWGRYDVDHTCLFAFKGNNTTEFYRYQTASDSWRALESIPYAAEKRKRVKKGSALCFDRYDTLVFALKGNNTLEFWRYDAIRDSWLRRSDIPFGTSVKPKRVKGGSGLAFYHNSNDGNDYVYALKGSKTTEFWRYHVQSDSWQAMRDVPLGTSGKGMPDGSSLVNAGGTLYALKGSYNELYSYNIGQDSWYPEEPLPIESRINGTKKKAKYGTALCHSGGVIYALKGGTCQFWGYFTDARTWQELDSMPRLPSGKPVKGGGALAFGAGVVWALKGNKTVEFWSYDPGADAPERPQHSVSVQAGLMPEVGGSTWLVPNPMRAGFVTVRLSGPVAVSIYDALGRMVLHSSLGIRNSSFPLDLRSIPAGVYLVRLSADGITATQKLVIQR